jgi:hypothetical protein
MAEKERKGWFRGKGAETAQEGPEGEGEPAEAGPSHPLDLVEGGPVRRIHFGGRPGTPEPTTEREFTRIETTHYNPHHTAPLEDIHWEVDRLGSGGSSSAPPPVAYSRTLYTTERGSVKKAAEGRQSAIYLSSRKHGTESERRFSSTMVDPLIEDVDLNAPSRPSGPYVHDGYTLHSRVVELKGGGEQTIYFFSKKEPKSGTPCALPEGYEVGVSERTGLPFLRRSGSPGEKEYQPQCAAITDGGKQCRNSARGESKYCSSHAGHHPKTLESVVDTAPAHMAQDTKAGSGAKGKDGLAVQCSAITADGKQCRNNARDGKATCASHKSYRAPTKRQVVDRLDTRPRWSKAKDTRPKTRKASR